MVRKIGVKRKTNTTHGQWPEIHRAAGHRHPAKPHDDFGRDRRENVLQRHEKEDADKAALLYRADDKFVHGPLTINSVGWSYIAA